MSANAQVGETSYSYDLNNRLISVIYQNGLTFEYEYDHLGNRIVKRIGDNISCNMPTEVSIDEITQFTTTISWSNGPISGCGIGDTTCSIYNEFYWREVGTQDWNIDTTSNLSSSYTIGGLFCMRNYEFKMRLVCTDGFSIFSPIQLFTTLDCPTNLEESIVTNNIVLYPNPNNGSFKIEMKDKNIDFDRVRIYSTSGQSFVPKVSIEQNIVNVKTSNLSSGLYLIFFMTNEKEVVFKKFLIE